jgi:hypothetical protein
MNTDAAFKRKAGGIAVLQEDTANEKAYTVTQSL